jgi:hypothetical protein
MEGSGIEAGGSTDTSDIKGVKIMSRFLRVLSAVAVLLALAGPAGLHAKPRDEEIRKLTGEIRALKLLQDLRLSNEQLRRLHAVSRQAAAIREAHEQQLEGLQAEAKTKLAQQRDRLLRGEEIEGRELKQVKERHRSLHEELREQMRPLIEEAEAILNAEQKSRIAEKLGRGRRSPEAALEHVLAKAREADESEYPELRQRILERHGRILRERGLPEAEAAERSERLGATLDEARRLDEESFKQRRGELAEGLLPKQEEAEAWTSRHGRKGRESGRRDGRRAQDAVGRWLASDSTLRALEGLLGR